MRCGIEFEYLLIDTTGKEPGRVRDFSNLPFHEISEILDERPGGGDPRLATGVIGIRRGYWYLEGDGRFDEWGRFRALAVKGVEVRTPPEDDVFAAVRHLLDTERGLSRRLAAHGLGLAINGYNPAREGYAHEPPLNGHEIRLRHMDQSYRGSLVSTLTYGPDINLSMPGWPVEKSLDAARKLNHYGPYIVSFSLNSPFAAGRLWGGCSIRTWRRAGLRPAVILHLDPQQLHGKLPDSPLIAAARSAQEHGRIEFKAFDALPSAELLGACAQLLVGICLDEHLPGRSETADVPLYRRAALRGFDDGEVRRGAEEILRCSRLALIQADRTDAARGLGVLAQMLERRQTPAHAMVALGLRTGYPYKPGGLGASPGACRDFCNSTGGQHEKILGDFGSRACALQFCRACG